MTTQALTMGILKILKAIGRWVLDDLVSYGVDALIGYMRVRIGVFGKRRARAKRDRRKRWLAGRIKRWTTAMRWLEKRRDALTRKTVRLVREGAREAVRRIPERSRLERFAAA